MKKLNSKGFTLIELLAVITIMGILMLVAIPAVSRTIENSRRDTFMDTAKAYVNAVKNAVASDELYFEGGTKPISAGANGYYYYIFHTRPTELSIGGTPAVTISNNSSTDLMEQGGKSSWGNSNVFGVVAMKKTVDSASGRTSYLYAVAMVDEGGRGIDSLKLDSALKRTDIKTAGIDVSTDAKIADIVVPTGTFPNDTSALTWTRIDAIS